MLLMNFPMDQQTCPLVFGSCKRFTILIFFISVLSIVFIVFFIVLITQLEDVKSGDGVDYQHPKIIDPTHCHQHCDTSCLHCGRGWVQVVGGSLTGWLRGRTSALTGHLSIFRVSKVTWEPLLCFSLTSRKLSSVNWTSPDQSQVTSLWHWKKITNNAMSDQHQCQLEPSLCYKWCSSYKDTLDIFSSRYIYFIKQQKHGNGESSFPPRCMYLI